MNIIELDQLVAIIEAENDQEANGALLAYYAKARKALIAELNIEIKQILEAA